MLKFKKKYIYLLIILNLAITQIFSIKDPFVIPDFNKKINNKISLNGIIKKGSQYGAILSKGEEKKIVFLNDLVWDYKIQDIKLNYIIINKGSKTLKLTVN